LVLREVTERPEAVSAGTVKIVGTDKALIIRTTNELLDDKAVYQQMTAVNNPYGDGKASERIIAYLQQLMNQA
jgi:UDP-N-acetylglucosamine 2-epimerase (non-hydrolysing)